MEKVICTRCGFSGDPLGTTGVMTKRGKRVVPLFHTERGKPYAPVCNRCRNKGVKEAYESGRRVMFYPYPKTLQWLKERERKNAEFGDQLKTFLAVFQKDSSLQNPFSGVTFLAGDLHEGQPICPLCEGRVDLKGDPFVAPKEPGSDIPSILVHRRCFFRAFKVAKEEKVRIGRFTHFSQSRERDKIADRKKVTSFGKKLQEAFQAAC